MVNEPIRKQPTLPEALHYYSQDRKNIEAELENFAARYSKRIPDLLNGMFKSGGKRLRPILTAAVMRCFGADPAPSMDLVALSEIVHTASLIHDDVVDGTDVRRGQKAAHVAFDSKTAVLSGDFLLAHAIRTMTEAGNRELLRQASMTITDLVEGEVFEIETGHDPDISIETVQDIQRMKTASLFSYAAQAGIILSGGSDERREQAYQFGTALGMAFQAEDDLLDWTGNASAVGKPLGQDLLEGKLNLPMVLGVHLNPALRDDVRECWNSPNSACEGWINSIRNSLNECGAIAKARQMVIDAVNESIHAMDEWPDSTDRQALIDLVLCMVSRNS